MWDLKAVLLKTNTTLTRLIGTAVAAGLLCLPGHPQGEDSQATFDTASVKPARDDAPMRGTSFMIGLGKEAPPRGLLTMTAPLAPFIMFAYNIQDEVEARAFRARLPEWAQRQKFTIIARPPQDEPTLDQIRQMMRTLLQERFGLQAHRATHIGPVRMLTVARKGVTGPGLRPHEAATPCLQRASAGSPTSAKAEAGTPASCGLELHQSADGLFHVNIIDASLPEACTLLGGLGGVLGGREMDTIVDGTGLAGRWDLTLDFLPERDGPAGESGGPTFTSALEKQLGLQLQKGTGPVEDLIIDHIAEPTAD